MILFKSYNIISTPHTKKKIINSTQEQSSIIPLGSSHCCLAIINPTNIHEDMGLISGFTQWVKDLALL